MGLYFKYKDKNQEQLDIDKFKYKTGQILKYSNSLYRVVQYSQSPFKLSPEISCYILERLDLRQSKQLFKLGRSQTCLGKIYQYRIPRDIVDVKFKKTLDK